MAEYLDIYDEDKNYLGKEDRNIVHRDALWHNTVHCWLYDNEGNIFFQIRKDENKFYTTASGHVLAGETIKEGFGREVKEEIGIDIDYDKAILVNINKFIMDKEKKDGSIFRDRAFANVYICEFDNDYKEFHFDLNEIDGVVKINAKDTLSILKDELNSTNATYIVEENNEIKTYEKEITKENFLVYKGETLIGKYGDVVNKVIEVTK